MFRKILYTLLKLLVASAAVYWLQKKQIIGPTWHVIVGRNFGFCITGADIIFVYKTKLSPSLTGADMI